MLDVTEAINVKKDNFTFSSEPLEGFPRVLLGSDVTIGISAHGNHATTYQALNSLFLSVEGDYELILVDDFSQDRVLELFCAAADCHFNTKIFSFDKNLEYSGSLNAILSHASGDYVIFLSNDIFVSPSYIYKLLEVARHSVEFGIVRGCSNFVDNGLAEHNIIPEIELNSFAQIFHFSEEIARKQGDELVFENFLTGDAFLVSRKVLDAIGTLDPAFYGYFADQDLGLRASIAGFKLVLARGAFAVHNHTANLDCLNVSERASKTNRRWARVHENWARFKIKYGMPVELAYEGVRQIPWKKIIDSPENNVRLFQCPGSYLKYIIASSDGDIGNLVTNLVSRVKLFRMQALLLNSELLCMWGLKRYLGHDLILTALGAVRLSQGLVEDAIDCLRLVVANAPLNHAAYSNLLMAMNYSERCSQEEIFAESCKWGAQICFEKCANKLISGLSCCDNTVSMRIRVGFISSDFRTHSVSYFFEPLLSKLDKGLFKIICYSDVAVPDAVTGRLEKLSELWRDTSALDDKAVIDLIRADRVDILFDLSGHTAGNRMRVFFGRAALVQVSWLGYPNTTGLSSIDYRLTDEIADPEGEIDSLHTERLVRLKYGFLCYRPFEKTPEVSSSPQINNGYVTFGSFNNIAKISPGVIAVWARILRRVKNSRLLLKCHSFADQTTANRYIGYFTDFGIARERIELRPVVADTKGHLAVYNEIDIALDTFPYNGTTTTFEALWMGVPVITFSGDRHASRVGASILMRLGLGDMVASSTSEYIDMAELLANSSKKLEELRLSLRRIMVDSQLCNEELFAREFGMAIEKMCESSTNRRFTHCGC